MTRVISETSVQISGSPWLARVQQFIQSPLSADSSPSHAAQSKPAAAKQLLQDTWLPQVTAHRLAVSWQPVVVLPVHHTVSFHQARQPHHRHLSQAVTNISNVQEIGMCAGSCDAGSVQGPPRQRSPGGSPQHALGG